MALSRKHFTILAEVIGSIEAGRIGPDDVRQVIIDDLLADEPTFKRDKFEVHADKQRDAIERDYAKELIVGEGFVIGAQRFVAERIVHLKGDSLNVETVEVRAIVDDERASEEDSTIVLYFDAADRI